MFADVEKLKYIISTALNIKFEEKTRLTKKIGLTYRRTHPLTHTLECENCELVESKANVR